jgi:hypothetical protein
MKVISGVNAGAVVGSFVPDIPAENLEAARNRFSQKTKFCRSLNLHHCNDQVFKKLMEPEFLDPAKLTYDEQVYFSERSIKHLAPHVLFSGFEYILPFINTPFMDFMLSIDNQFRRYKILYKKILKYLLPKIFSIPIEGNYALPIDAPSSVVALKRNYIKARQKLGRKFPRLIPYSSPMMNYMDFDKAFREKTDLKNIVQKSIADLDRRKIIPWINGQIFFDAHQSGKYNYSDLLLILFSLEIHLKAGKVFNG